MQSFPKLPAGLRVVLQPLFELLLSPQLILGSGLLTSPPVSPNRITLRCSRTVCCLPQPESSCDGSQHGYRWREPLPEFPAQAGNPLAAAVCLPARPTGLHGNHLYCCGEQFIRGINLGKAIECLPKVS